MRCMKNIILLLGTDRSLQISVHLQTVWESTLAALVIVGIYPLTFPCTTYSVFCMSNQTKRFLVLFSSLDE